MSKSTPASRVRTTHDFVRAQSGTHPFRRSAACSMSRPAATTEFSLRGQSPLRQRHQRPLPLMHEEPWRLAVHLEDLVRERERLDLVERSYRVVAAADRL